MNYLESEKKKFESLGGDWSNVIKMQDLIDQGYSEKEAIAKFKENSSVSKVEPDYDASSFIDDTNQKGATGGTFTGQDLNQFQELLNRLTSSKMTQQKQKSKEGRKDIYAGGMANMMRNF